MRIFESLHEDVREWACPGSVISGFYSGILNPDFISSNVIKCRVVPLTISPSPHTADQICHQSVETYFYANGADNRVASKLPFSCRIELSLFNRAVNFHMIAFSGGMYAQGGDVRGSNSAHFRMIHK